MKKLSRIVILTGIVLLSSCWRERTTYRIEYQFDNTIMQSEFLEVYENNPQAETRKWRSTHHHFDTLWVDGQMHEWASGHLDDCASPGCLSLDVVVTGFRPYCGLWVLDTVFPLVEGQDNHFVVTPDMLWHNHYEINE